MNLKILACQHIGKDPLEQQDAIAVGREIWQRPRWHKSRETRPEGSLLLSVADGVSASTAPALASRSLLEVLHDETQPVDEQRATANALTSVIHSAFNRWNQKFLNDETSGASTTIATLLLTDGRAAWANSGDSRIYRVRSRSRSVKWKLLSHDHTIWNELVESGEADPAQEGDAATMLTHGLMHCLTLGDDDEDLQLASGTSEVRAGDFFILCTDGIHGVLSAAQMEAAFDPDRPLDESSQRWWEATMKAGAPDNFSYVFCKVVEA